MLLFLLNQINDTQKVIKLLLTAVNSNFSLQAVSLDSVKSILTFIFGGGSIISILKLFSNYKEKQQKELVSIFSETSGIQRLSGYQGLLRYSRMLYRELFFICCAEEDLLIKEFIFDILKKQSPHFKKHYIQLNDFLSNYYLNNETNEFILIGKIMEVLEKDKNNRLFYSNHNQVIPTSKISGQDNDIENYLNLSSTLLAASINKSFFVMLQGNLIAKSDMYVSKWRFASIENCVFIHNDTHHMLSYFSKYCGCYIFKNNYRDSRFIRTFFMNCELEECQFNKSIIKKTVFEGKKKQNNYPGNSKGAKNINNNKSKEIKNKYIRICNINNSDWNGCFVSNCKYEGVQFCKNNIKGSNYLNVIFKEVIFLKTNIISGFQQNYTELRDIIKKGKCFKRCKFENVAWNISKLDAAFIRCIFQDGNFNGTEIKNSLFFDCTFNGYDFSKMKSISNTKFIKCKFKDIQWKESMFSDKMFTDCTF